MKEQIRLNKFLASCGVCSRRDADILIQKGVVTIDGKVAQMGQTVTGDECIAVRGKVLTGKQKTAVLAYYKPVGITCSERDAHAEKLIMDRIKYPVRLTYAGRLDKESEGLMILTNDGDLIHAMMKGANGHEKEYIVKVQKEITEEFLQKMSEGLYLKELDITTRPCEIKKIGKYTFSIILTQGVNRQIRRMCKALGYQVTSLKRIRIMNVLLDDLQPDKWRELKGFELETLYRIAGLNPQKNEQIQK